MLTRLEAVNVMLEGIGEETVSALGGTLDDSASAERILDRTLKETLALGWSSNVDGRHEEYQWTRDANDECLLGDDVLRIDTVGPSAYLHGRKKWDTSEDKYKLWDTRNARWTFTSDPYVEIIWNQTWDEASDAIKNYVAYEASVRFAMAELGSIALSERLRQDRDRAWNLLMDEETSNEDYNILRNSHSLYRITHRPGRGTTRF